MYDIGKVKAGANRVYQLAPSPVTFMVLIRAVRGSLAELKKEFSELNASTRNYNKGWWSDATQYEARLEAEQAAAQKIVDAVANKTGDWQGAIQTATDYAKALKRFFMGDSSLADSALWASLANRLEPLTKHDSDMFWSDIWLGQWNAALSLFSDGESDLVTMAAAAKEAGAETYKDAKDFAKPALGILGIALLVGGAGLLAWKLSDK